MKKRLLGLTLAIITTLSCFTGCGNNVSSVSSARSSSQNINSQTVSPDNIDDESSDVKHIARKYKDKVGRNDYDNSKNAVYSDAVCEEDVCEASEPSSYSGNSSPNEEYPYYPSDDYNTEEYNALNENGFCKVSKSPLSTFSADVDTASYSNLRRFITQGYGIGEIPTGAVRTEEMLNYFSYNYNGPKSNEPFGVNAEISSCPWNPEHQLLMLGIQTEAIDFSQAPDSNIVFLIDVSGSMYDENKLPLLKKSLALMLDNLTEKDKISIVTYASGDEVILEGVPASDKAKILEAIDSLEAGGSTNGSGGIVAAYEIAENNFIKGGNNRILIATDGDFNVGLTSESDLTDLISEERENGIFLSVLGFGMGNYADARMESLADNGNGNYAYIDNITEAKKVLVEELGANMVVVAKDVKFQAEFNPAYVAEYRLIGYEDRVLATEDFDDDTKDAGEIGAGHSVTVMYELVPADDTTYETSLKYQTSDISEEGKNSGEWLTVSVRYKEPDKNTSELLEYPIDSKYITDKPSDDFKFASCVVEFAELIRNSQYSNDISVNSILSELKALDLDDEYKEEFYELVKAMR